MSSTVCDSICNNCKSNNAVKETFNDEETGYIFECYDCKYMEVYRKNIDSEEVIEDYSGFDHYYQGEKQ